MEIRDCFTEGQEVKQPPDDLQGTSFMIVLIDHVSIFHKPLKIYVK